MSVTPCAMAPAALMTSAAPAISVSFECFQMLFIELPPQAARLTGPKMTDAGVFLPRHQIISRSTNRQSAWTSVEELASGQYTRFFGLMYSTSSVSVYSWTGR